MANAAKKAETISEKVDTIIEAEDAVVENKVAVKKKANKPKHDPSELILCRSVCFGELILIGPKTHIPYNWSNEGDLREVEYQDLLSWKALRSKYIFEPFIVIEDDDLREEWKTDLGKLYDSIQTVDLKAMFTLPHRSFVSQLKKLPDSMKSTVQNMACSMIQDGTLYDLRTIRAIDEILGTELMTLI